MMIPRGGGRKELQRPVMRDVAGHHGWIMGAVASRALQHARWRICPLLADLP
jgi:hypothetical protein